MPLKKITNNKDVYYIASMISNFILVISSFFLSVYLIIPLFGGKLLVSAIIRYTSWLGVALTLKIVLKRIQKKKRVRKREYLLIYLATAVSLMVCLTYPFNLVLSTLTAIILAFSYKTQKNICG